MPRVRLLTNLGSNDFPGHPYKDGEEHEVSDSLAARLLAAGLAVEVKSPAPLEPAATSVVAAAAAEPEKPKDKFQRMRGK